MKNKVTADQIRTTNLAIRYAKEQGSLDLAVLYQHDLAMFVLKALADNGSVLAKLALQEVAR